MQPSNLGVCWNKSWTCSLESQHTQPFPISIQGGDEEACTAAQSEAQSSPASFHVSAHFTCSSSFTCSSCVLFRQAHLSAALAIGSGAIGNHPVSGRLSLLLIHEERSLSLRRYSRHYACCIAAQAQNESTVQQMPVMQPSALLRRLASSLHSPADLQKQPSFSGKRLSCQAIVNPATLSKATFKLFCILLCQTSAKRRGPVFCVQEHSLPSASSLQCQLPC